MRAGVLGLGVLGLLVVGCASEVDPGRLPIEVELEGWTGERTRLRAQAVYLDADREAFAEVVDDQPFQGDLARLVLRPPLEWGTLEPVFPGEADRYPARIIEVLVYVDEDANQTLDPGEAVGRLGATSASLTWRGLSGRRLREQLREYPMEIEENAIHRYLFQSTYDYDRLQANDRLTIAAQRGCLLEALPACLPQRVYVSVPGVRMVGPSAPASYRDVSERTILWPYLPVTGVAECSELEDNVIWASYTFKWSEALPESCQCAQYRQEMVVVLGPLDRPDWLVCEEDER